jgi:hypothetical protein
MFVFVTVVCVRVCVCVCVCVCVFDNMCVLLNSHCVDFILKLMFVLRNGKVTVFSSKFAGAHPVSVFRVQSIGDGRDSLGRGLCGANNLRRLTFSMC